MENEKYSEEEIDIFWRTFLKETNRNESTKYFEVFHFELTEKLSNKLLKLVLAGEKRATSSSLWRYNIIGESTPQVGDLSIVTDWKGIPQCIIETTCVTIIPFFDITYDICRREGEDDSLDSWIEGHTKFFKEEGKQLGYEFYDYMPVVFEDFKVIYSQNYL